MCDRHTASLLIDYMIFCPEYRDNMLVGVAAMVAERIIRQACKDLDIEVIDVVVNPNNMPLLIKYPPKYPLSYIEKLILC